MKKPEPLIGLVHAVEVAMAPVDAAFKERWPGARLVNFLDAELPADLEREGRLNGKIAERIKRLADRCMDEGAAAVLFTCSAFGAEIEQAARSSSVPVLKPNEAMFDRALSYGKKVGMLATFGPAVASMETEFYAAAREKGAAAVIETLCIPEALTAAKAGNYALHNRLLMDALPRFKNHDVLLLAHFSMAPAVEEIQANIAIPVLTSPHAAVEKLKAMLS